MGIGSQIDGACVNLNWHQTFPESLTLVPEFRGGVRVEKKKKKRAVVR